MSRTFGPRPLATAVAWVRSWPFHDVQRVVGWGHGTASQVVRERREAKELTVLASLVDSDCARYEGRQDATDTEW